MANTILNFQVSLSLSVFKYAVSVIISIILLRYFFRLMKPRLTAFLLKSVVTYLNEGTGHQLKSDLFGSLKVEQLKTSGQLRILEVGAGTGANFNYFPNDSQVIALEPNSACVSYLKDSAKKCKNIELIQVINGCIEDLVNHVEDGTVDAVVCTFVLCSVDDVAGALQEIRRVLKPNGRFYFLEHVRDFHRNSWTHIAQRLIHPVLKGLCDCDCLKNTGSFIDKAGFRSHTYKQFSLKEVPIFTRPSLVGYATK